MVVKTLDGCSYSQLWVSPANWQKATKKDLDKEYEEFKKTLDEVEFENDFDKSLIEMLIGEFGSNGINESDLENAKRVFNESRENLEKGKEKEEVEKVEKTERGIW